MRNRVKISYRTVLKSTVEVRTFTMLPNGQWHRIGTWNMPIRAWGWMRSVIVHGCKASDVDLTLEEADPRRN